MRGEGVVAVERLSHRRELWLCVEVSERDVCKSEADARWILCATSVILCVSVVVMFAKYSTTQR